MTNRPHRNITLHFDGGCAGNPGGRMTYGWHADDSDTGERIAEYGGEVYGYPPEERTNNTAEFTALLCGLEWVAAYRERPIDRLTVRGDSNLVVNVMARKWKAKKEHLKSLMLQCFDVVKSLDVGHLEFEWVPREQNAEADRLADR